MTFTIDISVAALWLCGIAAYFIVSGLICFFLVPALRQDWTTMIFLFIFSPIMFIFMTIPYYGIGLLKSYWAGLKREIDRKRKRVGKMGPGRYCTTDINNIRTMYVEPTKHMSIRPHWLQWTDGKWELTDEDIWKHLSGYKEFDPETIISVVHRMEENMATMSNGETLLSYGSPSGFDSHRRYYVKGGPHD